MRAGTRVCPDKDRKMSLRTDRETGMSAFLWTSPACHCVFLGFSSLIYKIEVVHFLKELTKENEGETTPIISWLLLGTEMGKSASLLWRRETSVLTWMGLHGADDRVGTSLIPLGGFGQAASPHGVWSLSLHFHTHYLGDNHSKVSMCYRTS